MSVPPAAHHEGGNKRCPALPKLIRCLACQLLQARVLDNVYLWDARMANNMGHALGEEVGIDSRADLMPFNRNRTPACQPALSVLLGWWASAL